MRRGCVPQERGCVTEVAGTGRTGPVSTAATLARGGGGIKTKEQITEIKSDLLTRKQ